MSSVVNSRNSTFYVSYHEMRMRSGEAIDFYQTGVTATVNANTATSLCFTLFVSKARIWSDHSLVR
jgi:hypothetical protein